IRASADRLILGFADRVQLWDPQVRRLVANLGENGRLLGLAAGGQQVMTVELPPAKESGEDEPAQGHDPAPPARLAWWDLRTGRAARSIAIAAPLRLSGDSQPTYAGALSGDGRWVALAYAQGGAGLWDTKAGTHVD